MFKICTDKPNVHFSTLLVFVSKFICLTMREKMLVPLMQYVFLESVNQHRPLLFVESVSNNVLRYDGRIEMMSFYYF